MKTSVASGNQGRSLWNSIDLPMKAGVTGEDERMITCFVERGGML